MEALERARKTFDRSPQIELALGVAYYSERRFEEAAVRFLRVMELDASVPQPYIFLGKMLDHLADRLPELRAKFAAWNQAETTSHYPPLVLAKSLPVGERRALLEESVRREANYWESHFELAVELDHQRDLAGAARELEAAVKLDAAQAPAHYRLARLYERLNRPVEAARHRQIHAKLVRAGSAENGGAMR